MIDSYSALQTALNSWAMLSESAADLQTFIGLAEAKFKRMIRHREMENETNLAVSSMTTALPSGFISVRYIYLDTDPKKPLQYVSRGQFFDSWAGSSGGEPDVYSISGSNIIVGPGPDSAYTVKLGYLEWISLSDSITSNWLLASYPDVYLQASLAELYRYNADPEKAAYYDAMVSQAIDQLNDGNAEDEAGEAPLMIRSEFLGS